MMASVRGMQEEDSKALVACKPTQGHSNGLLDGKIPSRRECTAEQ